MPRALNQPIQATRNLLFSMNLDFCKDGNLDFGHSDMS